MINIIVIQFYLTWDKSYPYVQYIYNYLYVNSTKYNEVTHANANANRNGNGNGKRRKRRRRRNVYSRYFTVLVK